MAVDFNQLRRMTPAGLDLFKRQAALRAQSGDPAFARLVSMPEYQALEQVQPPQEQPLWMKGLQTATAPFRWIEENITQPFGAIVTSPFTPSVEGTENLPWLQREREEYRQWDDPSLGVPFTDWQVGVKGIVETLPWLAVPSFAGVAGKLGVVAARGGMIGRAAGVASRAIKPAVAAERAIAYPITKPVELISKKLAPRVTHLMADLQNVDEAIVVASQPDNLRKLASLPMFRNISRVLGGKSATMKSATDKAIVGRLILREEGKTKSSALIARLEQYGNQEKVFGKIGVDGRFMSGEAKGILQNELFTYPQKYVGRLNNQQKVWIETAREIEQAKLAFLRRNGIKIKELTFDEGGEYAGQRVAAKFSPDGELLDYRYVGAGPSRPGGKIASEKTRIFYDPEEAAKAGYRYLGRDEALALNVQGAYNRVADKKSMDWLLDRIPYRTAGATELTKAKRIAQAVRATEKGKVINPDRMRLISKEYPDIAQRLRDATKAGDREAVATLRAESETILQKAQLEWNALSRTEQAATRQYARGARYGEAAVRAPAFQGKILTGPDARETARLLTEEFEPKFSEALAAVNKVNSVGRYFALAGDISPFSIQLIFLAGMNPRVYGSALKGFVRSFFDPEFAAKYMSKNADIINNSPGLLLARGGTTEFTEAMARGGLLRQGPLKIGGRVLEPFQRGFEGAIDVAGIELKKSLQHMATSPQANAAVDAFVNEFRGLASTSRLGVSMGQRQLETAAILAPKYNRAIAALLSDVFRNNLRGKLARESLARGVGAIAAMTVVISAAMGEDEDQIVDHLNPASPNFMTWKIAGQNIGPGSKVRSLLRLFAQSAKNPDDLAKLTMENPGLRFVRGNLSPTISTGLDLLTGQNFVGDPTRDNMLNLTKTVIGENLMPIWVQSVAFEGGDLGGRLTRGAAEFAGGRGYPLTPYQELEQLRDDFAQRTFGMNWDEVGQTHGKLAQEQMTQASPELQKAEQKSEEKSSQIARGEDKVWVEYRREGERIEDYIKRQIDMTTSQYRATLDGGRFKDRIDDIFSQRRALYNGRETDPRFQKIRDYFNEPPTPEKLDRTNPMDIAYQAYMAGLFGNDMTDEFGEYRFDEADRREALFVQQFGVEALKYVDERMGVKRADEPPELRALRQARKVLRPYWEIENQVWAQFPPQLKEISDQIQNVERTDQSQADRMLLRYPQIVWARKQIAFYRKFIKQTNPAIAQALATFYIY